MASNHSKTIQCLIYGLVQNRAFFHTGLFGGCYFYGRVQKSFPYRFWTKPYIQNIKKRMWFKLYMRAEEGDTVKVHFTGSIEGNVFDQSHDKGPFVFKLGSPQVIAGFQEAVRGMQEGESRTIKLPPEKAYGHRDETLTTELPLDKLGDLPEQVNVEAGVSFQLKDKADNHCIVTVKEVRENNVLLDLNHPLAGKELEFNIQLLSILRQ